MKKIRLDKWLWSVRIYKTRTLATDSCKSGKVRVGEKSAKPSYSLTVGELVSYKKNGFNFTVLVKELINKRVSAALAAPCYEDRTPADELHKYEAWYIGKGRPEQREKGVGRPTKKERRIIDQFKESSEE